METASEIRAEHVLLAAAIILSAGSVLGYFARRLRVPDIVLFLIAGIVLGPELLGVLNIPATSSHAHCLKGSISPIPGLRRR